MSAFERRKRKGALSVVARRGERMCLLSFDVKDPPPDFLGFAVEVKSPGSTEWMPLRNRIAFAYDGAPLTGFREYPSLEAPFQSFRWIHFPYGPKNGTYRYRVTMLHGAPGATVAGDQLTITIPLSPVTYDRLVDVGFTRNFASSQAFNDLYADVAATLLPAKAKLGLAFAKPVTDAYAWLGFEALELLEEFLAKAEADKKITVDLLAYDLNEPWLVERLKTLAARPGGLRALIDSSDDHAGEDAAEDQAAAALAAAGASVRRMKFRRYQHNKVLIARRNGQPIRVLCGSTNFSFRGLYIQANNLLVFHEPQVAALFGRVFDLAFQDPEALSANPLTKVWHTVTPAKGPTIQLCFSPHTAGADLSLAPVAGAIDQAASSVLFSSAFLSLDTGGPVRKAIDRLMDRPLFSYGIVDKANGLKVRKPSGEEAVVSFGYLSKKAPQPFKAEWRGGSGICIHHKFVVTDFNLPTAKVFTGSSNMAAGGEKENGDHLIQISDCKIATAFAIEALRMFDHLHFRAKMAEQEASGQPLTEIKLWKPGDGDPWWTAYYQAGSRRMLDRQLFAG